MDTMSKVLAVIYENEGIYVRELSRRLKVGIPTIKYHIERLEKEKMIKSKKEGRNLKFYVNYANNTIVPYIQLAEQKKIDKLPRSIRASITEILKILKNKPLLVIIFGSYAKGNYTDKSDLDIYLVLNKIDEDIEKKSKAVHYKYGIEISPVYVTFKEFKRAFFDSSDKFMAELKKKRIIVHGIEWWVMLENERQTP